MDRKKHTGALLAAMATIMICIIFCAEAAARTPRVVVNASRRRALRRAVPVVVDAMHGEDSCLRDRSLYGTTRHSLRGDIVFEREQAPVWFTYFREEEAPSAEDSLLARISTLPSEGLERDTLSLRLAQILASAESDRTKTAALDAIAREAPSVEVLEYIYPALFEPQLALSAACAARGVARAVVAMGVVSPYPGRVYAAQLSRPGGSLLAPALRKAAEVFSAAGDSLSAAETSRLAGTIFPRR